MRINHSTHCNFRLSILQVQLKNPKQFARIHVLDNGVKKAQDTDFSDMKKLTQDLKKQKFQIPKNPIHSPQKRMLYQIKKIYIQGIKPQNSLLKIAYVMDKSKPLGQAA